MSDKQVEIWDMAYKSTTSVRDTIWAVYCRGFKDGVTDTTDRIKDGSCFACKEIYNQALEDALNVVEWDGYTLDIKERIEKLKK